MGIGTLSTSTPSGARQSRGLASLAGLSAHEISETRTDPWPFRGWYDSTGAENVDKVIVTIIVAAAAVVPVAIAIAAPAAAAAAAAAAVDKLPLSFP